MALVEHITPTAPVLFIVFARPEPTEKVFSEIRKAEPRKLYIAADASRGIADEDARVAEVRRLVTEITWECEVKTLFQEANQGPGLGPRAAITWFFENEESGIILEDDCLPDPSFFQFASELLIRYSADPHIAAISGTSFAAEEFHGGSDYFASCYTTTWGWATWRRAWSDYEPTLESWSARRSTSWLRTVAADRDFVEHWTRVFDTVRANPDEYWDYQFQYLNWERGMVSLHPRANLISNVGFGEHASHTSLSHSSMERLDAKSLSFPLTHPSDLEAQVRIDRWISRNVYGSKRSLKGRIARRAAKLAHKMGVRHPALQDFSNA